jgi:hypothetical protein
MLINVLSNDFFTAGAASGAAYATEVPHAVSTQNSRRADTQTPLMPFGLAASNL